MLNQFYSCSTCYIGLLQKLSKEELEGSGEAPKSSIGGIPKVLSSRICLLKSVANKGESSLV